MGKPKERLPSPPPAVVEGVRVNANRCPFCHDDVVVESELETLVCEGCLARHHVACWQESGACGACGASRPLTRDVERPKRRRYVAGAAVLLALPGAAMIFGVGERPVVVAPAPAPVLAGDGSITFGAEVADFPGRSGAVVKQVWAGSAAWTAGLEVGDLIQSIDGQALANAAAVSDALSDRQAGDTVRLQVMKFFKTPAEVSVKLTTHASPQEAPDPSDANGTSDLLGARVQAYPDGGVTFVEVPKNSLAQRTGFESGDRIESLNGRPTPTPAALKELVEGHPDATVTLGVRRHYGDAGVASVDLSQD